MTLKEVKFHADAYWWQRDEMGELLAHFTSIIANPHYKSDIKPNKIYKRRDTKEISKEEQQAEFDKAVKLMGAKSIPVTRQVK